MTNNNHDWGGYYQSAKHEACKSSHGIYIHITRVVVSKLHLKYGDNYEICGTVLL